MSCRLLIAVTAVAFGPMLGCCLRDSTELVCDPPESQIYECIDSDTKIAVSVDRRIERIELAGGGLTKGANVTAQIARADEASGPTVVSPSVVVQYYRYVYVNGGNSTYQMDSGQQSLCSGHQTVAGRHTGQFEAGDESRACTIQVPRTIEDPEPDCYLRCEDNAPFQRITLGQCKDG